MSFKLRIFQSLFFDTVYGALCFNSFLSINSFRPIRSYATCLEGALKIKELTYMHSEGTQISSAEDYYKSRL
jgi:hypothetical protein